MSTMFWVVCIVAIVFTADTIQRYLKLKGPKKTSDPDPDPELEETLAHIERLEERIRVLERIVTENKFDLGREIDRLK